MAIIRGWGKLRVIIGRAGGFLSFVSAMITRTSHLTKTSTFGGEGR